MSLNPTDSPNAESQPAHQTPERSYREELRMLQYGEDSFHFFRCDESREEISLATGDAAVLTRITHDHSKDINEDGVFIHRTPCGKTLLGVLDGMGGHGDGALAAEVIADAIQRAWRLDEHFVDAVKEAPKGLASEYRMQKRLGNDISDRLGAVFVGARLAGDKALVASCGDAKLVHIRNGSVLWENEQQTLAAELLKLGRMTAEEIAADDSLKGRITAALCLKDGQVDEALVLEQELDLLPGDVLVLASDGVWDHVSSEEISDLVGRDAHSPAACESNILSLVEEREAARKNELARAERPVSEDRYSDDIALVVYRHKGALRPL